VVFSQSHAFLFIYFSNLFKTLTISQIPSDEDLSYKNEPANRYYSSSLYA
jgi:hypothetical protein